MLSSAGTCSGPAACKLSDQPTPEQTIKMDAAAADVAVKVAVRSRPMSKTELLLGSQSIIDLSEESVVLKDPNPYSSAPSYKFHFDHNYPHDISQQQVYEDLGSPILDKAFQGYNGTIFAYGQTGTGKTHCIMGSGDDLGIIPRMNKDLFARIENQSDDKIFLVSVSFLELYNETIFDLLNPKSDHKTGLKVREHPKLGVYVEDLIELVATSSDEVDRRMSDGNSVRHVASTKMNDRSSRSHSVFIVKLEQRDKSKTAEEGGSGLVAKINLVDLAGSERVAKTEAEGNVLKEASAINKSLSALGNVINALGDPKKKKGHIPFRSSKLTRLLQESLGGNTITVMIATLSPADRNFEETLNTLQYANRAKNIQNKSKKNETNPSAIMRELRDEIERLKEQLGNAGSNNPEQLRELNMKITDLEYAKKQTWDEKQRLSRAFEESRWASLAKNGMLQFRMNLMKKQKQKSDDRIQQLEAEVDNLRARIGLPPLPKPTDAGSRRGSAADIINNTSKEQESLRSENEILRYQLEQKSREMDALCTEVQMMISVEADKMSALERQIAELTNENKKLKNVAVKAGVKAETLEANQAAPLRELTSATMADYLKTALRNDAHVVKTLSEIDVKDAASDGVILCKFVNRVAPGILDERVVNTEPQTPEEVVENINLCLNSAMYLGCDIQDVTIEDIVGGDEKKLLLVVTELERVSQLNKVNVKEQRSLLKLRLDGEELEEFINLTPEQLLIRWMNYHLFNAGHENPFTNFSEDVKDSVKYILVLNQIASQCGLEGLGEANTTKRAQIMLSNADKLGCRKYITVEDIVSGNPQKNQMFITNLYLQYPDIEDYANSSSASGLEKSEELLELMESKDGELQEERAIRVWVNSLDLGYPIPHLSTKIEDGILLLQVLDKVYGKPLVNWKKVNQKPVGIYKKIENCNYAVDLGRELNFSLVGVAGKDFVDKSTKFALAFLSQAMQYHFLRKLQQFGGKEITEADMVRWVNEKVKKAGKTKSIKGFRDATMKDGLFLIDLLDAIHPGSVNYNLVSKADNEDGHTKNTKYVISVARKLGCHIFLTWEDIVQVQQKKILYLVAELMTVSNAPAQYTCVRPSVEGAPYAPSIKSVKLLSLVLMLIEYGSSLGYASFEEEITTKEGNTMPTDAPQEATIDVVKKECFTVKDMPECGEVAGANGVEKTRGQKVLAGLRRHKKMIIRLLILVSIVVAIIVTFFVLAKVGLIEKGLVHLRKIGHWGLLVVAAGEFLAGFPIPNLFTLFCIFGGFVYGFWKTYVVALPCAIIGYTVAFIFCRRFLRERVKKTLESEFTWFTDVEEMIEKESWKFVFLLRFSPIPFGILNMILSTTKIPLHVFCIAGVIPTAIVSAVYTYLGTTLKSIQEALNSSHMGTIQIVMICVNITATILVIVIIGIIGKKAYKKLQSDKEALQKQKQADETVVVQVGPMEEKTLKEGQEERENERVQDSELATVTISEMKVDDRGQQQV
ncbi:kinesin-like protein [Planoprotostelium fungivorum]|uniref:Kinesin-like protein n=1 Tax=Planoprotostelium fungivorum TaxID=1890364 RepID=A0A2P6NVY4_9EUKA|nr:kinesin-like protein [Planoprotostelium fungivorum]